MNGSIKFILQDKAHGGNLHRHLRCQKQRCKRYGSYNHRGRPIDRVRIDERLPPLTCAPALEEPLLYRHSASYTSPYSSSFFQDCDAVWISEHKNIIAQNIEHIKDVLKKIIR